MSDKNRPSEPENDGFKPGSTLSNLVDQAMKAAIDRARDESNTLGTADPDSLNRATKTAEADDSNSFELSGNDKIRAVFDDEEVQAVASFYTGFDGPLVDKDNVKVLNLDDMPSTPEALAVELDMPLPVAKLLFAKLQEAKGKEAVERESFTLDIDEICSDCQHAEDYAPDPDLPDGVFSKRVNLKNPELSDAEYQLLFSCLVSLIASIYANSPPTFVKQVIAETLDAMKIKMLKDQDKVTALLEELLSLGIDETAKNIKKVRPVEFTPVTVNLFTLFGHFDAALNLPEYIEDDDVESRKALATFAQQMTMFSGTGPRTDSEIDEAVDTIAAALESYIAARNKFGRPAAAYMVNSGSEIIKHDLSDMSTPEKVLEVAENPPEPKIIKLK